MGVLGAIRVDGTIDQIISQGSGADYQKNLDKLQKIANKAIPKLADRLDGASQQQAKDIVKVLSDLATIKNSEHFKLLFTHQNNQVRDGVDRSWAKSDEIIFIWDASSASSSSLLVSCI